LLIKHHQEGRLFQTRYNPKDKPIPLDLNLNDPVYVYQDFIQGETNGSLIYYPKQFNQENHEGLTKLKLIEQLKSSPFPGWNVILLEDNPFLAKENKGKIIGGRKQIENNKTSIDYLKLLQTQKSYQHEYGLTIEDWLTKAIQRLHEKNEVINIYEEFNLSFLIGNVLSTHAFVPGGSWYRDNRRVYVYGDYSAYRGANGGALSAVRITLDFGF